jgi:hypothetical protein
MLHEAFEVPAAAEKLELTMFAAAFPKHTYAQVLPCSLALAEAQPAP